jgi:3-phosphoshikimate 1-carboxyvinyltransferase
MIDEYPILACLAAFADGTTEMQGLAELKVKESDRLAATAAGLAACGVSARIEGDDLIVEGRGEVKGGGTVETHMDHRIAMAFLTLGLGARRPVRVDDVSMIKTSFPGFAALMTRLGAKLS